MTQVQSEALWQRLRRVFRAPRDGRDPDAAYEMPPDNEQPVTTDDRPRTADEQPLTADDQVDARMSSAGRQMAELLDEWDHELRAKRTGGTQGVASSR